jgi:molybdopterin/thiamine biosynthesis adenylyltransferase
VVELSNLQRQILHGQATLGSGKVQSATQRVKDLNQDVRVTPLPQRLDQANVDSILAQGWDVVLDGLDNFPTRYLVNDACRRHGIAVVHGSVSRFEGRVTTFAAKGGPCYRCLFPSAPPEHVCTSCDAAGVLGVLPGVIGTLQAMEAIKLLVGLGEPLLGRLLTYDALGVEFHKLGYSRDPHCATCNGLAAPPGADSLAAH